MTTDNVVYSVRIHKELRELMEELKEINWQREIKEIIERRVKEEYRKKLMKDARKLRRAMKVEVSSAKLIREDRDAR